MDFKEIESKWNKYWEENKTFKFNEKELGKKQYILEMFTYPSGSHLHVGHLFNYSLPDCFAKYKIMKGENVFQPMGFDAFGLPAENFALKTGIHPRESTTKNMEVIESQLAKAGLNYEWDYAVRTCEPEYYKWTQWLFLKLFEKGLAVQKYAPVNWCPSCNTVLANEQVVDGECERCGSQIMHKNLTQWFFKITDYAEKLIEGLDRIDFPEKTKVSQRNWIGKSVGAEVEFKLEKAIEIEKNDKKENVDKITVFTSRPDTIFGVTYLVLAPENPLTLQLTTSENKNAVEDYIAETIKKDEISRQNATLEKTGIFTGSYAINPVNNKKIPIFTADYVLATYATGAVMGVPAHDERDFDFAKKYNLKIKQVIKAESGETILPYTQNGLLVNSGDFDGMKNDLAKEKIISHLASKNQGRQKTNYKLRDWSVSRQRYWGCPIPIIHCEYCGTVPVPEKDLPVLLPNTMDYRPDGTSPLAKNEAYMNVICPKCGRPARRDPDTLDTFVCSSFYMLRYPNARNNESFLDPELTNKICPVDYYFGGMEHANGHLLYSRFITKVLYDCALINFDEPFKKLTHQGMILGPDGQKMSKSKGNVINPDDLIKEFGADAVRLYFIFGFNYADGGPWNDEGVRSCSKFMDRVVRLVEKVLSYDQIHEQNSLNRQAEKDLVYARNYAISELEKNMNQFTCNSAVARIMELVNALYKYDLQTTKSTNLMFEITKDLVRILAPFIPHTAEELWQKLGEKTSVFKSGFPIVDESKLKKDEIEIVAQINSKIVARIMISTSATQEEIQAQAKSAISEKLTGKIIKTIIIPNRLINFIMQ